MTDPNHNPPDAIKPLFQYLWNNVDDVGYGFYRPPNPHDFCPDMDNTAEEHAAHKAACEAYDRGEYVDQHPSGWITPDIHVTTAPWGMGSYRTESPEVKECIEIAEMLEIGYHRYEAVRAKHIAEHPRMTNEAYDAYVDGLLQEMQKPCDGNHAAPACGDVNCWHKPEPFVQRKIAEYRNLKEKTDKLEVFITDSKGIFPTLDADEQQDLRQQFINMTLYGDALKRRIMRRGYEL